MAYLCSPHAEEFTRPQKRHVRQEKSGFDLPETRLQWQAKIKGPSRLPSSERTPEMEFGIKRKIDTIEARRNGIGIRNPGDKFYTAAEAFPGFYKQEGHIVGSTIDDRRRCQTKKVTDAFEPPISYHEKKRLAEERAAEAEVMELTVTKDGTHSWEETTGLFVWLNKTQRSRMNAD